MAIERAKLSFTIRMKLWKRPCTLKRVLTVRFVYNRRFGTTLMKTEDGDFYEGRRRRRQIDNDTWYQPDYEVESITEAIEGDLAGLDFSQVFGGSADDEYATDDAGSELIDPRALHLIDLMSQPDDCLIRSILQIWDSDLERIRALDERQIVEDVNEALRNG